MIDFGMPQEEFDELVKDMEQLQELRVEDHVKGPGSRKG